MTSHNPDTREKLPICERLEAWAKVSFSQDRARDLLKARDTIEALVEALEEAHARLVKLGDDGNCCISALSRARNGGQP